MLANTCSSIPAVMPRPLFFRLALALGGPASWSCLLPLASEASTSTELTGPPAEAENPFRIHRASAAILRILRGQEAAPQPAGAGVGARHLSSVSVNLVGLTFILLVLSACATPFDRYSIGTAELWIGGQVQVQQECTRRGAVAYNNQAKIYGCADFQDRVIISVSDPKIIAHEWCHWSTRSDSHDVCPTPVADLHPH